MNPLHKGECISEVGAEDFFLVACKESGDPIIYCRRINQLKISLLDCIDTLDGIGTITTGKIKGVIQDTIKRAKLNIE